MGLRASDPAGHHGLDIMGWTSWMGWTVEALWAAARVSWGSPHIWPDRRRKPLETPGGEDGDNRHNRHGHLRTHHQTRRTVVRRKSWES